MTKGLIRSLSRGPKRRTPIIKEVINFGGRSINVSATGAASGVGTTVVYNFPEGFVMVFGVGGHIGFAGSGSDGNLTAVWNGDYGFGTTATADATLDGTDVNILGPAAIGPAVAEVIAPGGFFEAQGPTIFDNSDGSLQLHLNLLIDPGNITDNTSVEIALTGAMDILYAVLGDD